MQETKALARFSPRKYLPSRSSRQGLEPDRAVVQHIGRIKACHDKLAGIDKDVHKALRLTTGRFQRLLQRTVGLVLPKRAHKILPNAIALAIVENYDALAVLESLQKTNINNIQEALRELAVCAIETREELDNLEVIFERAKNENWSAQELQAFMAERAGIQIYEEINRLLDVEFNALSDEEKEGRKEELLDQIQNNIVMGQGLMETMGQVCGSALRIFHRAVAQYVDYVHVQKPVAVIRDAAKAMIETNHSNFAAKGAIEATFRESLEAIKLALDTTKMVSEYSITAPDMQALFDSGRQELVERLAKLEAARPSPLKLAHQAEASA